MRVGDRNEPRRRMGRGIAPMYAADAACSQHGDADHGGPFLSVILELMF
jgi:hypothetical protein